MGSIGNAHDEWYVKRGPGKSKGLGGTKWETTEFLEQGSRRFRPRVREGCLEQRRPVLVKATTNSWFILQFLY